MPIPENLDKDKIAELSLALLALSAHGNELEMRAWKGMDWDVTEMNLDVFHELCEIVEEPIELD